MGTVELFMFRGAFDELYWGRPWFLGAFQLLRRGYCWKF